jgi:hypothetical protein
MSSPVRDSAIDNSEQRSSRGSSPNSIAGSRSPSPAQSPEPASPPGSPVISQITQGYRITKQPPTAEQLARWRQELNQAGLAPIQPQQPIAAEPGPGETGAAESSQDPSQDSHSSPRQ